MVLEKYSGSNTLRILRAGRAAIGTRLQGYRVPALGEAASGGRKMQSILAWVYRALVALASRVFIGIFVSVAFLLLPFRAELAARPSIDSNTMGVGEIDVSEGREILSEFHRWVGALAVADGLDGGFGAAKERHGSQ